MLRRILIKASHALPPIVPNHGGLSGAWLLPGLQFLQATDNMAVRAKHRCIDCCFLVPYQRRCGHDDLLKRQLQPYPFNSVRKSSTDHTCHKKYSLQHLVGLPCWARFRVLFVSWWNVLFPQGKLSMIAGAISSVTVEKHLTYPILPALCPVVWLLHVFSTYQQQLLFINCSQKPINEGKLIGEREEKAHKIGGRGTYRYFHRLHGEVTWWLQGLRPGGIPEGGECCKSSEPHEGVGWKGTHVLPDVNQLWHSKIPEQLMDFHGSVLVVL